MATDPALSVITPFEKPLPVCIGLPGQKELELMATSVEVINDGERVTELVLRNGEVEVGRFKRADYVWWKIGDGESNLAF